MDYTAIMLSTLTALGAGGIVGHFFTYKSTKVQSEASIEIAELEHINDINEAIKKVKSDAEAREQQLYVMLGKASVSLEKSDEINKELSAKVGRLEKRIEILERDKKEHKKKEDEFMIKELDLLRKIAKLEETVK